MMNWSVKVKDKAVKSLVKIDRKQADKIWRYRVGDYRLIAQIHDNELVILVIEIGHCKDVYN